MKENLIASFMDVTETIVIAKNELKYRVITNLTEDFDFFDKLVESLLKVLPRRKDLLEVSMPVI